MLDFLSVVPAKESVIDTVPNIFDYSELAKYGYSVRYFVFFNPTSRFFSFLFESDFVLWVVLMTLKNARDCIYQDRAQIKRRKSTFILLDTSR